MNACEECMPDELHVYQRAEKHLSCFVIICLCCTFVTKSLSLELVYDSWLTPLNMLKRKKGYVIACFPHASNQTYSAFQVAGSCCFLCHIGEHNKGS